MIALNTSCIMACNRIARSLNKDSLYMRSSLTGGFHYHNQFSFYYRKSFQEKPNHTSSRNRIKQILPEPPVNIWCEYLGLFGVRNIWGQSKNTNSLFIALTAAYKNLIVLLKQNNYTST